MSSTRTAGQKVFSWFGLILATALLAGGILQAASWADINQPQSASIWTYIPGDDALYYWSPTLSSPNKGEWEYLGTLSSLPNKGGPGLATHLEWQLRRLVAKGLAFIKPWGGLAFLLGLILVIIGVSVGGYAIPLMGAGLLIALLGAVGDKAAQGAGLKGGLLIAYEELPLPVLIPATLLFLTLGTFYLVKHRLPRVRRWWSDFLKKDPDRERKQSLDIKSSLIRFRQHDYQRLASKHKSKGFFLGLWNDDGKPAILPHQLLSRHIHVLGSTGSGKTSRVLLPLAIQAIERGMGATVLDWKGDCQMMAALREAARAAGKNFFVLSLTHDSHNWNMLEGGNAIQIADRIMIALELVFRDAAKFYTLVQKASFIPLIQAFMNKGFSLTVKDIHTALGDRDLLAKLLPDLMSEHRSSEHLKGLRAALAPYALIPQINTSAPDFSIADVVRNEDILYCHLSSQAFPEIAAGIGKMIYMGFEAVAASRNEQDRPYLLILDEFQDAACPALKNLVSKVRSANYCLLLSNQSEGQLVIPELGGPGFLQTVKDNTAVKIVFRRLDGDEADRWARSTGQEPYQQRGMRMEDGATADGGKGSILDHRQAMDGTISTAYKPLIPPNVLLSLPEGCALVLGVPGHLPGIASLSHPWGLDRKRRLESSPWPSIEHTPFNLQSPVGSMGYEAMAALLRDEASTARNGDDGGFEG